MTISIETSQLNFKGSHVICSFDRGVMKCQRDLEWEDVSSSTGAVQRDHHQGALGMGDGETLTELSSARCTS